MDRMITNAPSNSAAPEGSASADMDAKSAQATIYVLRCFEFGRHEFV